MKTRQRTGAIIFSILFFSIFLAPRSVFAETRVSGALQRDTTWDSSDGPYIVEGTVTVQPGVQLTIMPGTRIIFTENGKIYVRGTIVANGTESERIVVTTEPPDTFLFRGQEEVIVEIPEEQSVVDPILPKDVPTIMPEDVVDIIPIEEEKVIEPENIIPEEVVPEVLGDIAVAEELGMVSLANSTFADRSITVAAATYEPKARGYFSFIDFENTDYGVRAESNASVVIDTATFSGINYFPIYAVQADMEITNSVFSGGEYAGFLQEGSFIHENNTFNTEVPGWWYAPLLDVGESHTVNSTDGVYYIYAYVPRTATLTIGPGISIYHDNQSEAHMTIEGNLIMNGTFEKPITVYGSGECVEGAQSIDVYRWWGHQNPVPPDPTVSLSYVNFSNVCSGIKQSHGILDLNHVTFNDIDGTAVRVEGTTSITMKNSEIMNSGTGIDLYGITSADISNNSIHNNDIGAHLKSIQAIDIRNNNWGSINGPTIETNPLGDGNTIIAVDVGSLLYCSWIGKLSTTPCPLSSGSEGDIDPETPTIDRDPVIIIPGIIGTELIKNYDDYAEVWPNLPKIIQNLADSQLDDLALLVAGEQSPVRPMMTGDVIRSIRDRDVIQGLMTELINNGYSEGNDLFVLPYDWRLSNAVNAAVVQEKIQFILAVTEKSKVDIIAHSMGGLLAKEYIAQYDKASIDQLFFVGTPHLGAPKAFKTLMYGDDMGFSKNILGLEIPFLSSNRIFQISQNMPSLYELLPSEKYVDTVGPYVADLVGDYTPRENEEVLNFLDHSQTEQYMDQKGRNNRFFERVNTLHERIDSIDLSGIRSYNIAACGVTKTIDKILVKRKRPTKIFGLQIGNEYDITYGAGDDTVPLNSAKAVTTDYSYYVKGEKHSTLPSVPVVREAIINLLNDTFPVTTNELSPSANNCGIAGKTISIYSPVELNIYGDNGHVGPLTGKNTIEYSEKNIAYDIIGNEKFAFLPEGSPYTILLRAEEIGAFDMSIGESSEDNTITTERFYYDIPIAGLQTSAYMNINADGTSDYILHIDQDGDGVFESYRAPARVVSGSATSDVMPPTTTSIVDGATFSLSANDIETGVLETLYSTDETTWHHYSNPVTLTADATVEFFSVDNLGNSEEVKSAIVRLAVAPEPDVTETEENEGQGENPSDQEHTDENDETNDDTDTDTENEEGEETDDLPGEEDEILGDENEHDGDEDEDTNESEDEEENNDGTEDTEDEEDDNDAPGGEETDDSENDEDGDTDNQNDGDSDVPDDQENSEEEENGGGSDTGGSGNEDSDGNDSSFGSINENPGGTVSYPSPPQIHQIDSGSEKTLSEIDGDRGIIMDTSTIGLNDVVSPDTAEDVSIESKQINNNPKTNPTAKLLANAQQVVSTTPALFISAIGIIIASAILVRRKYKKTKKHEK